jgi:hypothetical protein
VNVRTDRELPVIACTLGPADLTDRRARWRALAEQAFLERSETEQGVRLAFRAGEGVEAELRELAALERECCSFAHFEVSSSRKQVVLDVSAPSEAVPAVRAMFG